MVDKKAYVVMPIRQYSMSKQLEEYAKERNNSYNNNQEKLHILFTDDIVEKYLNYGNHQTDKTQYLNEFFAKTHVKIDIVKNNKYKVHYIQGGNDIHEMEKNELRKYLA